jgi:hypothetical protein
MKNFDAITNDWSKIKNKNRVKSLTENGWTWDPEQTLNPGQLNAPEGTSWYDAESDNFDIEDGKAICESCLALYDYEDEPKEVKEGGTHICQECWNKPE